MSLGIFALHYQEKDTVTHIHSLNMSQSPIIYDGGSVLSLAPGRLPPDPAVSAIFLGNGKLAVVPAVTTIDSMQSMITGSVQLDQGRYDSGAVPVFRFNRIRAFGDEDAPVTYRTTALSLSMDTSIFSITLAATSATGSPLGSVSVDMYAHSSLPFCFMQTVNLTLAPSTSKSGSDPYILHDLYTDQTISRVKFNNSVLHLPSLVAPLYLMTGVGESDRGSGMTSSSPRTVATGCCYLLEDATTLVPQGFNVYANDRRRAYTRLSIPTPAATERSSTHSAISTTYRFHVLTATISSDDFQNPEEEVRRILLNVVGSRAFPGQGPIDIANRLRADHVRAWSIQWANSITISPKTMATVDEKAAVVAVQRASRFALYNLISTTRSGARITSDPAMLSVIDTDGSLLYRGDVWFLPTLLLLRPDCARTLLEYRRKTLENASQLAQCYGYSGAKYGYTEDVFGYASAVYFDSSQPQHLYNSSLIAIAVWNQFRSTNDTLWLQQTGYDVLRGVANFLVSAATPSDMVEDQFSFLNVLGYGTIPATNNVLTVATAKLALTYTIQATYVLSLLVRTAWVELLDGLVLPTAQAPPPAAYGTLVLVTDESHMNTTVPVPTIIDCLMPLLPWYQHSVFPQTCTPTGGSSVSNCIADNVGAYLPGVILQIAAGTAHPYNVAILAGLSAVTAQATGHGADAATFQTLLTSFINSTTDTTVGWGNFVDPTRSTATSTSASYPVCDMNLACLLLFVLINCVAGVQVRGSVTDTRFFSEECRILASDSAILPVSWASLTISRVGPDMTEVRILNQQVYSSTSTSS